MKNVLYNKIASNKLPKHVAIIMDGNGRWAEKNNLLRIEGHREGAKRVDEITKVSRKVGIKVLTLYAFSTENWSRPDFEIKALFSLLEHYIKTKREVLKKNNIKFSTIGDLSKFPSKIQKLISGLKKYTKNCNKMILNLALNYGSQDEIKRALKKMFENKDFKPDNFPKYLDTVNLPDPELLIRTSGEKRLSNFLLYQLAYAEFYFTKKYWPEFTETEFYKAIIDFQKRNRRFGGI